MDHCNHCRGSKKCQSCGGTGIGVLETKQNLDDPTDLSSKFPSLVKCRVCGGGGKCQVCADDSLAIPE
jgi:hypothetical protein